jgi:hypothetical protein
MCTDVPSHTIRLHACAQLFAGKTVPSHWSLKRDKQPRRTVARALMTRLQYSSLELADDSSGNAFNKESEF